MKKKIIFLHSATVDMRKASDWYEEQKTNLGREFLQAVLAQAAELKEGFINYRFFMLPVRYAKMKRFPYSIFFIEDEKDGKIIVIAVLGNKQDMLNIIRERFPNNP